MVKSTKNIKFQIKELRAHSDERGWLVEMLKRDEIREGIKQIYVATIKPGCVRGNHYHLKRTEWFFIASGRANLYLEDIKTKEKVKIQLSSQRPKVVTIFPQVSHALENLGEKKVCLVSAQNTIYDPEDTDTFLYSLI